MQGVGAGAQRGGLARAAHEQVPHEPAAVDQLRVREIAHHLARAGPAGHRELHRTRGVGTGTVAAGVVVRAPTVPPTRTRKTTNRTISFVLRGCSDRSCRAVRRGVSSSCIGHRGYRPAPAAQPYPGWRPAGRAARPAGSRRRRCGPDGAASRLATTPDAAQLPLGLHGAEPLVLKVNGDVEHGAQRLGEPAACIAAPPPPPRHRQGQPARRRWRPARRRWRRPPSAHRAAGPPAPCRTAARSADPRH